MENGKKNKEVGRRRKRGSSVFKPRIFLDALPLYAVTDSDIKASVHSGTRLKTVVGPWQSHNRFDIEANCLATGESDAPLLTRRLFQGSTYYRVDPLWRLFRQVRKGETRSCRSSQLTCVISTINMSPADATHDQICRHCKLIIGNASCWNKTVTMAETSPQPCVINLCP